MGSIVVYNAVLCDAGGRRHGWLAADGGVITSVGEGDILSEISASATEAVDAGGAMLIPGLTDTHVHFRDPGLTHKATLESESRAAAAGAVTTVFDMPNTVPAVTTVDVLDAKRALIKSKNVSCRIIPLLGMALGAIEQLKKLDLSGIPAVKLFLGTTTGAMSAPSDAELEDVFRFLADHGIPVIVHAEDNDIIARNMEAALARWGSVEAIPVAEHCRIRSHEACLRSAARAVELATRFGTRLHLAHVSTAAEVRELLTDGPTKGKLITAETTPLYLDPVLCSEVSRNCRHKVNPAIKTPEDAESLREALFTGRIDTIGTDHAPHLLAEKERPGMTAMSGAPSIQFALPLMLTYLPAEKIIEKMTCGPADVFGIGVTTSLEPGAVADFAVVREVPEYTLTDADAVSLCSWTPFAGRTLSHRVERTWCGGVSVWPGR